MLQILKLTLELLISIAFLLQRPNWTHNTSLSVIQVVPELTCFLAGVIPISMNCLDLVLRITQVRSDLVHLRVVL